MINATDHMIWRLPGNMQGHVDKADFQRRRLKDPKRSSHFALQKVHGHCEQEASKITQDSGAAKS